LQADAENTELPENSIDTIICSGMLHHLDLSYAFPELRRILAPGGRILAIEALNYNPLIKLYRYLTPAMRTDWEKKHILSLKDLKFAKRFFRVQNIRYWHIVSILAPYMKFMLHAFNRVDSFLTKIPLINLMAWIFTFELHKPNDED
jgi:SAM-dependent methyltransferase